MKIDEVYEFFGSANKASKAIGIKRATFSVWIKRGYIPIDKQQKFELLTKHALIASLDDAKKSEDSLEYYLPMFRYYDKKYGMREVESIFFRKGKPPKITYKIEKNKAEKFSVFTNETLMQAINVLDKEGNMVYEGDICLLSTREKFIVKDMNSANKLKKAGKFKIIGNIYEK